MQILRQRIAFLLALCTLLLAAPANGQDKNTFAINEDGVLVINGEKIFPIMFTMPPPADGKTPDGKPALQELKDAGANFVRTGPFGKPWDLKQLGHEQMYLDAAAAAGLYASPNLRELSRIEEKADPERELMLRELVTRFKDHPAVAVWKGADEPEWGGEPVAPLVRAREVIRQLGSTQPILIIQAPRGTVQSLRQYDPAYDITGVDIYPVGYPPGGHSLLPNNEISVVGDHVRMMMDVAEGRKPVWATLQISWSGVVNKGRTLRFPTLEQQRYMTYQAIVNGARGLTYFGGHFPASLSPRDAELGWNWTFWTRVLRPVIEEIGEKSPLYRALLAPNSSLPIRAAEVEFVVREVGDDIFIIACKREGETKQIRFLELPADITGAEVLFESPRTVELQTIALDETKPDQLTATFTDWFGPFDVHVYRLTRSREKKSEND